MRWSIVTSAAIFILAGLLWLSCKKSQPPTSPDTTTSEPAQYRHAFFPLAVGNCWTYDDTVVALPDTVVRLYTMTLTGFNIDSMGLWWNFTFDSGGIGESALMEKMTVYII